MKIIDTIDTWISGDWGVEFPNEEATIPVFCMRSADIVPIYQDNFHDIPTRYVTPKTYKTRSLSVGDIVIEKSGGTNTCSTGRPIFISKELLEANTPLLCSNFCCAIRIKKGWNPKYIYYFLRLAHKSNIFFNFEGKTSGIHNLDVIGAFNAIDIPNISIEEQNLIVKQIDTLDRKIALNRRMNATLEAMAKQLYDYWFVQFDFPNAEGKPYKSSGGKMVWNEKLKREIPEGWIVCDLDSVIGEIETGKRPSGGIDRTLKEGIPSLGAGCIDNLGEFNFNSTPYLPFGTHMSSGKINSNDILLYKDGEYVGKTTLFKNGFPYKNAYVNEHVFLIRAKESYLQEYLYYTLHSSLYFNAMQLLGKVKAAQPGLNQSDLKKIMVIKPDNKVIRNFSIQVSNLFDAVFNNSNQNRELIKLRDTLLPLLMNGQVTIKD